MRLFVGIPLDAAVHEQLAAVVARFATGGDGVRWSAPDSWHITLQFLGETCWERCQRLIAALRTVHQPPVPVSLEKLGCFERVFIAAVHPTPQLLALQQKVVTATQTCGFVPENRPYQAHITLARSRELGRFSEKLQPKLRIQPHFGRFVASEFLLYESFTGRGGAHYEVRERFSLEAE